MDNFHRLVVEPLTTEIQSILLNLPINVDRITVMHALPWHTALFNSKNI